MTDNSREAKPEIINTNNSNITKGTSTSSRSWSGLKDPRIVRVSRTFGGKDRHSKVCTIRGLRDRRVRLSVPTAIQLYDLQDRLGLNQPSKVVDWLLNAAKHEIDELPPLQIPPGAFGQFPQSMVASHGPNDQIQSNSFASLIDAYVRGDSAHPLLQSSTKGGYKIINDMNVVAEDHQHQTTDSKSMYWNLNNSPLRSKNKEVHHDAEETMNDDQRSNWMSKRNKQAAETQEEEAVDDHQVQNSPNVMPAACNSFYHWDPSNLSLSHLGSSGHGFPSNQGEDNSNAHHNYNVVSMAAPSNTPWSLPSGSHQVLVCPSGATTSIFQPFVTGSNIAHHQQINHFQMLSTSTSAGSSSSQNLPLSSLTPSLYSIVPNMRPFQLGVVHPKLDDHSQQNNNGGHGL